MSHRFQSVTFFERSVHTMFGSLAVLALIYCIVLLSLVFSVIEKKQNALTSRDLTSTLSVLESKYANTVESINDSALAVHDYQRVEGTTFAVRKDAIASYTVLYAH